MLKAFDRWLLPYLLRKRGGHRLVSAQPIRLVLTICDHFEPFHQTDKNGALARVRRWKDEFPRTIADFKDSDGTAPKHSFFYPIEQYDPDILAGISEICKATGSETEIHLHHDGDTASSLRDTLEKGKSDLARHGLLSRTDCGDIAFGFIHGDWALDNSHPSGSHCGVPGELGILREAGCYADFTLPSAPSPTQTRTINSIYYAQSQNTPKSHDRGISASTRTAELRNARDQLLLVQGPLGLNWGWRKAGLLPRVENGDLTGANPPTPSRLRLWLNLAVHVGGHESVVFAKLHTHGALPKNADALLGDPMRRFHAHLAELAVGNQKFSYHYATARQMVNLVHALEDSKPGHLPDFATAFDHVYKSL